MLVQSPGWRIARTRWQRAQEYEEGFWRRLGENIEAGTHEQLGWYRWRADRLVERLAAAGGSVPRSGKVLEIGSGPIGIVNFLGWGERYAIDPLEHFYRTRPSLTGLRQPGVTYLDGSGERLPFEDRSFELVIIDNVIDHTFSPRTILEEIRRVLHPEGYLFLSVNVHTRWGAWLHDLLARLGIDRGHPYTFTSAILRQVLAAHHFAILTEQVEDYGAAKRADLQSCGLKPKVKGAVGLSEFSHSVVCRADDVVK
jgi:ubiquinone/menaquinone biosynthesis C-methylase UbiE